MADVDIMSALAVAVAGGLRIALGVLSLVLFCAVIWFAGTILGRPIGVLFVRLTDANPPADPKALRGMQSTCGGMVSGLFAFAAICVAGPIIEKQIELEGFDVWKLITLLAMSAVMAEVALAVVAAVAWVGLQSMGEEVKREERKRE